jgi:hypothetical protein
MAVELARGSSQLGEMSHEVLHQHINVARESYTIERWWTYGKPAIDRVSAVINVTDFSKAGAVMANLVKLQGQERQIGLTVFPYGILNPEGVRVEVNMDVR